MSPHLDATTAVEPRLASATTQEVDDRRWWILGVLVLSLVVVMTANTSLNVAIPSIVRDTGASATELQWIVDAYALVFAGMLLTAGAMGDRFGREGYLQSVRGYTPLEVGVRILPMMAAMVPAATLSARWAARFGTRAVLTSGLSLVTAGLLVVASLGTGSSYWVLAAGLVLLGIGMGNVAAPATGAVMTSLPVAKAGVGSAVNDTAREVGGALGIAVLGSLLSSAYRGSLDSVAGVPAASLAIAQRSVGAAVQEAARLGGDAGAALADAARTAYADAIGTAVQLAAVVTAAAIVFVRRALLGRERGAAPLLRPGPIDAVDARGLVKRFGDTTALDGIDIRVPTGSVTAVLGPNGAGKTTAVRILATLTDADEGEATVAGYDVRSQPTEVRRRIGLTAQDATVDPLLTGRENLVMLGELHQLSRGEAAARATQLLDDLSLTDAADRVVSGYSGGMRRRLDLAATLVGHPQVLFLDEPTTGLDPRGRNELWSVLDSLVDRGTTVILTLAELLKALLPIVIMSTCGLVIGWRIRNGVLDAVAGYALLVAFAFAMIWVGVLLGSVVRTPEGVQGIAFGVLFPLTFMASTFVPTETMPGVVQTIAEWNPVTTLADAMRVQFGNPNTPAEPGDAWSVAHPAAYTLLWIAGIVAVCAPLAVRAYHRSVAN